MNAVLEIEKQIERLPVEDFTKLAAWMWERAEEEDAEMASRDEVFAILDPR